MKPALDLILGGGRVKRFHAKTTLHEESVAAHSYVVAWLVTLARDYAPSPMLLLAALQHDVPEVELGDMPAPAKIALGLGPKFQGEEARIFAEAGMPDFHAMLSAEDKLLLKVADCLSGWLTCVYEESLGNTTLRNTRRTYATYIRDRVRDSDSLQVFAEKVMTAARAAESEPV